MAYSAVGYTGSGTTRQYSVPFDYILATEVKVYVANVLYRMGIDYTLSAGVLTFTTAPAASTAIRIYRRTNLSTRKVEWRAGGSFTAADQNLNTKQLFFLCQELYDMVNGVIQGNDDDVTPEVLVYDPSSLLANLSLFLINHTTVEYP